MTTYTEADLAAAWEDGFNWCYDEGGLVQNPYRPETKNDGPGYLAKESTGTVVTSTQPNSQEEAPAMKTTSSIAETTPAVNVRPAWADKTETSSFPDGTPSLIHYRTNDGGAWMVTVEREDRVTETGALIHGTPKVLLDFSGDGLTPAELFGYAEAIRQAGHLLVDLRAAH